MVLASGLKLALLSSHCDPNTLAAIELAFDEAWPVLATPDFLARFTNHSELEAEIHQRLVILASDGVIDPDELTRQLLTSFPLA
jgi:hypothetical protein